MSILPLDLTNLRNDENHRVMIIGSTNTGDTYKGLNDADILASTKGIRLVEFAVGGSNEFQSIFELTRQQSLQNLLITGKAIISGLGQRLGFDINLPDLRLKLQDQTRLTWLSSTMPIFVISMMFVALTPDDDVRGEVLNLQRTTFPTVKGSTVYPPIGQTDGKGQFNVHIGKWFRAVNQVIRKVEFMYSKELVSPRSDSDFPTPLYAIGAVTFSPYRLPTAEEVRQYFPGVDYPKD